MTGASPCPPSGRRSPALPSIQSGRRDPLCPPAHWMAMACSSGSPGSPQELPADSPTPRATGGRQPPPLYGWLAAFTVGELPKGVPGAQKGAPRSRSVVAPRQGADGKAPKRSMRQVLRMQDAGIHTIVSIPDRMRTTPVCGLVTSLLARTDTRAREAIGAWFRSRGRSVERSRERSPERSSPPEVSPHETAGERP